MGIVTNQRTEPIAIQRVMSVSDGGAGSTGQPQSVLDTLAVVRILKPSRTLEANQVQLRQGYEFEIWSNPAYVPQESDVIIYRSQTLAMQGFRYADTTNKRLVLTALQ